MTTREISYRDAIREALFEEMRRYEIENGLELTPLSAVLAPETKPRS